MARLQAYLRRQTTLDLRVPADQLLMEIPYTFYLAVRNFLGGESTRAAGTVVRNQGAPPIVVIDSCASGKDVSRLSLLRLAGKARFSTCTPRLVALNFSWSVAGGPPLALDERSAATSQLLLRPLTLAAGEVHTLRLTAWLPDAPERTGSAECVLLSLIHI